MLIKNTMKKIIFLICLFCLSQIYAQIPTYVPTNGLVAYYPFNGDANDVSGNSNNGTVHGVTPTTDRNGNTNSAYSFNGSSNYISVPFSPTIGVQHNISVSFWVYFNGGGCGPRIMQSMPWGDCGGYTISTSSSSNVSRHFDGGFNDCVQNIGTSAPEINGLSWHHIVWTASGISGITQFYFDGILVTNTATNNFLSTINYNNHSLTIGNIDPNSCDWFGGYLDEIGIWNRILPQEEITNLYTADIACQSLVINTGLLSFNPPTYTNTVTIYPNPANDHITIDCGTLANVSGWNIKITNILGQEVFNQPMNTQQYVVPLNTWTGQGVYFVKIYDTQGTLVNTKKIILQ